MSGNHDEIQTDEEYNNTLTDMFPSELDFAKELDSFKEDLNLDEEDEFDYDDYLNNHYDDEDDEIEEEIDDENKDMIEAQKKALELKQKKDSVEDDEVKKWQAILYPEKKLYRSILLEYFPVELCIQIDKITRTFSVDNNRKQTMICDLLDEYKVPYTHLGSGTNRYGIMVDGYCVKIAYDKDGKIDNKREFIYSLPLQPYVVKTYEVSETGLFSVCEYVTSFERSDFLDTDNQKAMRVILKDISSQFLIGDVGVTSKNYANWGFRDDGSVVILDYAYIYSVSYRQFVCSCDGHSILYYDNDFIDMICPRCGKKFSFPQLRKKISRKDQDEEIGDITTRGYVLTEVEEEKEFNHKFVVDATDNIMKHVFKEEKKIERSSKKLNKKNEQDWDSDEIKSFDEILDSI